MAGVETSEEPRNAGSGEGARDATGEGARVSACVVVVERVLPSIRVVVVTVRPAFSFGEAMVVGRHDCSRSRKKRWMA